MLTGNTAFGDRSCTGPMAFWACKSLLPAGQKQSAACFTRLAWSAHARAHAGGDLFVFCWFLASGKEGRKEGRKKGRQEGRKEGGQEGRAGRKERRRNSNPNLLNLT